MKAGVHVLDLDIHAMQRSVLRNNSIHLLYGRMGVIHFFERKLGGSTLDYRSCILSYFGYLFGAAYDDFHRVFAARMGALRNDYQ